MDNDEQLSVTYKEKNVDDLEAIHGIGSGYAKALNQVGIYNYSDLAQQSAAEIAAVLTEKTNVKVNQERIESADWIGQAKKLARENGPEKEAQIDHELVRRESEETIVKRRQYAGFSLFFDFVEYESGSTEWQTRLYHEESGLEASIPQIEQDAWAEWIINNANLPSITDSIAIEEKPAGKTARPSRPRHRYKVELTIEEMKILPATSAVPDSYVVEVLFVISGEDAATVTSHKIPYHVEIQTLNLEAFAVEHFVESGKLNLMPDMFEYGVSLKLPMPNIGRYELQAIIYVDSPAEMIAYYTGPTINIR